MNNNNRPYDVIVVGSGATGGIASLTFAEAGIKVLVIEAGPNLTVEKAFGSEPQNSLRRIYGLISGRYKNQSQHPGYWKSNPLLYADELLYPYTYPEDKPYIWTQGRQVGGRSLTWGGITLRLSDFEFKSLSEESNAPKWPIQYSDLEEHYSEIERSLKIHGNKDGLSHLPDGEFISPLPLTNSEVEFSNKIKSKLGYKLIHSRGFGPKKSNNKDIWPASSSPGSTLKMALNTGNVEILENHMVENIIMNSNRSLAKGVTLVNQLDGKRSNLNASLIVLCASTIQTLRILLSSEENSLTNGLIDPSGALGKNLMDHVSTCSFFTVNNSKNNTFANTINKNELSGAGSFFIPMGNNDKYLRKKNFTGNYGIWGAIDRFDPPQFLKKFPNTSTGFLIAHGEVLPNPNNRVTLSNSTDKWGIQVPHINCEWGINEKNMVKHMQRTISEIINASGSKAIYIHEQLKIPFLNIFLKNAIALNKEAPPPGYYIHEVGGAPMGSHKSKSVVDEWNRLWQCPNVLVVDGACWPTSGWQSPTLTMMAITKRACINAIRNKTE